MKAAELFDLSGQVALVARRAERLSALKARIEQSGGHALAIAADVLDRQAMRRAFEAAEAAFGTVTILVNNAGVTHADRAIELEEAEWRRVLRTNLDAVFFWAQEAARRMIAAEKRGSIINIASILGFGVGKGLIAYSVAKAGVVQLTKGLALELAFRGVRVNAIAPGYVVTEINREFLAEKGAEMTRQIPSGRLGEERDLDGALLLLASDAGRMIAGATIVVDGGHMIGLKG